jgi:hypothetical protein
MRRRKDGCRVIEIQRIRRRCFLRNKKKYTGKKKEERRRRKKKVYMYIPLPDDGWNKVYSFFSSSYFFFPLSFGLVIYLRLLLWMDGQTLTERCKACPPPPPSLSLFSCVSPL